MSDYDLLPFGAERKVVVDAGYMAAGRHVIHGLVEIDVTEARRLLRRRSEELGVKLSLTAFLVASLGRAVAAAPQVQAFRDWRGRLVVFHDVDVVTMIEPRPGAVAIPHVIRATQRKSVAEITAEIRAVQNRVPASGRQSRLTALAPHLPRFMRLLFFRILKLNPRWFRNMAGTVIVTSVGMFGGSGGWGIGFLPTHNLGVTVGGISRKPGVRDDQIVVGEYLHLTLSFDHDIVDGAPAARFARRFVAQLEEAAVLLEDVDDHETTSG